MEGDTITEMKHTNPTGLNLNAMKTNPFKIDLTHSMTMSDHADKEEDLDDFDFDTSVHVSDFDTSVHDGCDYNSNSSNHFNFDFVDHGDNGNGIGEDSLGTQSINARLNADREIDEYDIFEDENIPQIEIIKYETVPSDESANIMVTYYILEIENTDEGGHIYNYRMRYEDLFQLHINIALIPHSIARKTENPFPIKEKEKSDRDKVILMEDMNSYLDELRFKKMGYPHHSQKEQILNYLKKFEISKVKRKKIKKNDGTLMDSMRQSSRFGTLTSMTSILNRSSSVLSRSGSVVSRSLSRLQSNVSAQSDERLSRLNSRSRNVSRKNSTNATLGSPLTITTQQGQGQGQGQGKGGSGGGFDSHALNNSLTELKISRDITNDGQPSPSPSSHNRLNTRRRSSVNFNTTGPRRMSISQTLTTPRKDKLSDRSQSNTGPRRVSVSQTLTTPRTDKLTDRSQSSAGQRRLSGRRMSISQTLGLSTNGPMNSDRSQSPSTGRRMSILNSQRRMSFSLNNTKNLGEQEECTIS